MKSRVHPKYKTKYRVGNWAEYDRALAQRGDITIWLSPEAIATWEPPGVGKRGGQLKYSDVGVPRRRAQQLKGRRSKSCCIEDEGRPLGIGVQAQISSHLELLGSRVRVVSVEGKGVARPLQVRSKKTSASEALMTCRKVFTRRRNRAATLARDESRGCLLTDWMASGMEAA